MRKLAHDLWADFRARVVGPVFDALGQRLVQLALPVLLAGSTVGAHAAGVDVPLVSALLDRQPAEVLVSDGRDKEAIQTLIGDLDGVRQDKIIFRHIDVQGVGGAGLVVGEFGDATVVTPNTLFLSKLTMKDITALDLSFDNLRCFEHVISGVRTSGQSITAVGTGPLVSITPPAIPRSIIFEGTADRHLKVDIIRLEVSTADGEADELLIEDVRFDGEVIIHEMTVGLCIFRDLVLGNTTDGIGIPNFVFSPANSLGTDVSVAYMAALGEPFLPTEIADVDAR